MRQLGYSLLICLVMLMTACGFRTDPKPITAKTFSIVDLEVIQRGQQIRLSWGMNGPIPVKPGSQQIVIEEWVVNKACLDCTPVG